MAKVTPVNLWLCFSSAWVIILEFKVLWYFISKISRINSPLEISSPPFSPCINPVGALPPVQRPFLAIESMLSDTLCWILLLSISAKEASKVNIIFPIWVFGSKPSLTEISSTFLFLNFSKVFKKSKVFRAILSIL